MEREEIGRPGKGDQVIVRGSENSQITRRLLASSRERDAWTEIDRDGGRWPAGRDGDDKAIKRGLRLGRCLVEVGDCDPAW